jgi:hypothetical protein
MCLAGLLAMSFGLTKAASADDFNKKTVFQFSAPVEILGRVLEPGKYVFQIADTADLNVVQVFTEDSNGSDSLVDTVLAVPEYTLTAPDTAIINFREQQPGRPVAIQNWFYPGDNWGWKFIDSKDTNQPR